ncbi:hypothetical protein Bca101_071111 [Brassica carinata]
MELSGVKTERRRMTMVSLEALQSLSSGKTRFLHVFKSQPPCHAPRSSCPVSMFGPLGRFVYLDFGR